jgi:putative SOS response-associated peptidase YedK
MCGRYTLTYRQAEQLALELGVPVEQLADYEPRYNIAPAQRQWIVRMEYEDRQALRARWGLINHWAKHEKTGFKQINARGETVHQRPAFRDAFKNRRCVVPADGFYEWEGPKGKRTPLWFHRPDNSLLFFAGLYESWQPEPEVWEPTYTIITTEANGLISRVHDRMPVILPEERVDDWLHPKESDSDKLRSFLVPAADDLLIRTAASPSVNSVKNDDPSLLEYAAAD